MPRSAPTGLTRKTRHATSPTGTASSGSRRMMCGVTGLPVPTGGQVPDVLEGGGRLVAVEGTWTLSIDTPIGEQKTVLALHRDGDRLTGSLDYRTDSLEIIDGTISGDDAGWKVVKTLNVLLRTKVTVAFTVTVEGDSMRGKADAGKFGTFDVTGRRG
ncbi:hypothetical protein ABT297_28325 [Dactylosporangium sp. NPDC000555]|uniref:hypothetical protein n=1 Tax=Dactylosporangium sp. NPDC000555 TaxID=3154260 RepID=UPI003326CA98